MTDQTIRVNLAGVKVGFEPLPAGYYLATISSCEQGISKAGNPKLIIKWQITEPEEYLGRTLYDHVTLAEGALFALKNILLAIGTPEDQVDNEEGIEFSPSELIGESVCLVIAVKGEYNDIRQYLPVDRYQ